MHYSTKMENGGQVTLPQDWLDELGLKEGDWITLESSDQKVCLTKSEFKGDESVTAK